jgi:hypothetical protein
MPVITKPNQHFDATLYTGNGTAQTITNAGGFQPDLVWGKARNNAQNHTLWNSVVGTTKYLISNATTAETTNGETLQSFNSNGYTLGNAFTNEAAYTYVGWQWKAGGAAVTNTAGTITSQVSANPTAGFSIVTYTGNGSNSTVGHGLGVAPSWVICKRRSGIGGWPVFVKALNNSAQYMTLNNTDAATTDAGVWNSIAPTSTTFSLGTDTFANGSGATYVAYCFAPVEGYSAFGSYTGNGSTDGPFVYLGFRPRWVMVKLSSVGTTSWAIYDSSRDTYNTEQNSLFADSSTSEISNSSNGVDFLSNGFKLRTTNATWNSNTNTFIYAAFAENPFKYANAR